MTRYSNSDSLEEVKTVRQSEKGVVAPLLMIVMIIGLVFGVYLIQQKTNLFSKATYTEPAPLVQDDFSVVPSPLGWNAGRYDASRGLGYLRGATATHEYINNGYKLALSHAASSTTDLVNVGISDWTIIVDVMTRESGHPNNVGIAFSNQRSCQGDSGSECVFLDGGSAAGINFEPNITYKLRIDKQDKWIKAWISRDQGLTWETRQIGRRDISTAFQSLPEGLLSQGTWLGLYIGAGGRGGTDAGMEAYFDNFKVWRYGQLPEPSTTRVTTTPSPSLTPSPSITPVTGQLTATCGGASFGNYSVSFTWPAFNVPGKTVQNYTLRINKHPGNVWEPRVYDLRSAVSRRPSEEGDVTFQVGTRTTVITTLSAGSYASWDVTPGFAGDITEAVQYKTFGPAFTCP